MEECRGSGPWCERIGDNAGEWVCRDHAEAQIGFGLVPGSQPIGT